MTKETLKIILSIANSFPSRGLMLNERYLHHYFTHQIQLKFGLLDLLTKNATINLHPEWPTYKKSTELSYGRYKNINNIYLPIEEGTAGFIDFAIGDYKKPDIGIEFSLKYGWSNEEIVYDFLKLLDKKNPFKVAISLNLIFRKDKLVQGGYLRDLEAYLNKAYNDAIHRLNGDVCPDSRKLYFIVTEIDKDNNRRHWHFDGQNKSFSRGLPIIP